MVIVRIPSSRNISGVLYQLPGFFVYGSQSFLRLIRANAAFCFLWNLPKDRGVAFSLRPPLVNTIGNLPVIEKRIRLDLPRLSISAQKAHGGQKPQPFMFAKQGKALLPSDCNWGMSSTLSGRRFSLSGLHRVTFSLATPRSPLESRYR